MRRLAGTPQFARPGLGPGAQCAGAFNDLCYMLPPGALILHVLNQHCQRASCAQVSASSPRDGSIPNKSSSSSFSPHPPARPPPPMSRARLTPGRAMPSVARWLRILPGVGRKMMELPELFGCAVAGVLADPQWASKQRPLAGVEIWAGRKTVASAAKQRGLNWGTVDINDGPEQDLTTAAGFFYGVSLIMAVAARGLAVLAPVCSSFVWANSSMCQRTPANNYEGDVSYAPVRLGNIMAKVAAFYFALAVARGLFVLWEQPQASLMFKLQACRAALSYAAGSLRQRCCDHCRFSAKPYGRRYKKPFRLISAGPSPEWAEALGLRCRCGMKGHVALMAKSADGKWSGTKFMSGSQAYSVRFGKAILAAWLKNTDVPAPPAPVALDWRNRQSRNSGAPQPSAAGGPSTSWRDRTTSGDPPPAAARARVSWHDRTTAG